MTGRYQNCSAHPRIRSLTSAAMDPLPPLPLVGRRLLVVVPGWGLAGKDLGLSWLGLGLARSGATLLLPVPAAPRRQASNADAADDDPADPATGDGCFGFSLLLPCPGLEVAPSSRFLSSPGPFPFPCPLPRPRNSRRHRDQARLGNQPEITTCPVPLRWP